ncbi:MAG TPA: hypothetical protein VG407_14525 [Caulobacteraceae bacterium]|jgi:hypothetical protein|nr:hypothetical protein [Caulobacteraceae bacterium]
MDGRTLLGALVRVIGFGTALFEVVQLVLQLVQLAAIGIVAAKQPGAGDAASAAMQQAVMPILIALILAALGLLLLRRGDAVANWAYSERGSRRGPSPTVAADKTAPAKRAAPKAAAPKSED